MSFRWIVEGYIDEESARSTWEAVVTQLDAFATMAFVASSKVFWVAS